MAKYCEKFNGILVSDKGMIFRARCKSWTCAYCSRENKTEWRKAIREAILKNPVLSSYNWVMLTFTMPPYVHTSPNAILLSAQIIKDNWNRFMMRFKKYYADRDKREKRDKHKFTYIRVLENHKTGVLHIHLLINLHLDMSEIYANPNDKYDVRLRWLKEDNTIESYGFGWRHNVLFLDDSAYAINYVTKYLSKDSDNNFADVLKSTNIRRIQTTRDIKAPHADSEDNWRMKYKLFPEDFTDQETYTDLNLKRKVTKQDLDEFGVYPPMSETETD